MDENLNHGKDSGVSGHLVGLENSAVRISATHYLWGCTEECATYQGDHSMFHSLSDPGPDLTHLQNENQNIF